MGRKHSKRRKYSKRRNTKRRNTLRKLVKRRNTKRINTKRRNTNNRVKNKNKFINGYKIIKRLNPHKSSIKYGGNCEGVIAQHPEKAISCIKSMESGSFGSVYRVNKGEENYAMKVIDFKSPTIKQSYYREVDIFKKLEGISNVVQCIENWVTNDQKHGIIIMNDLGDNDLFDIIDNGQLTEIDMWKYITQLAITIHGLHSRSIFHNDIKIENIMIYNGNAYLIDFGLTTETTSVCGGTVEILPPDKIRYNSEKTKTKKKLLKADCMKQHDIYSIAIVMFDFITFYIDGRRYRLSYAYKEHLRSINKNVMIQSSLVDNEQYNVSEEYKNLIIDIINGNINQAEDILLGLPEGILLQLPKDILLQLGDIYLSKLYDNIDRPEASIINQLRSIIIDDNASRASLIADKESLMGEIRDSEEDSASKIEQIGEIEQQLNDLCYLEKLLRDFLDKKEQETDTDTVKSNLKRIIVMLELEEEGEALVIEDVEEGEEEGEEAPVIEGVEEGVEAPVIEGEEEVEDWKLYLQTEFDLFLTD